MNLYFAPLACSLATRIAFYEAGRDIDYTQVDLKVKQLADGTDYLPINPMGQVPALRTDDGDDLDSDERAALDSAQITLADAIRTALEEVGGTLDDVELDEDGGTVAWEVSIDDDVEVYVDITTGEVLRVDRD